MSSMLLMQENIHYNKNKGYLAQGDIPCMISWAEIKIVQNEQTESQRRTRVRRAAKFVHSTKQVI